MCGEIPEITDLRASFRVFGRIYGKVNKFISKEKSNQKFSTSEVFDAK